MFSFLLQCCGLQRQRHHQTFDFDNTIKKQRIIYSTDNPYILTPPLSLYDMNTNDDYYSDGRSDITEEESESVYSHSTELHSITDASDRTMGSIRKNYVINRTQNYYIQRNSSHNNYPLKYNQDVQTLPGPTIKIINMAAERITDDPNWEEVDSFEIQYDLENNRSSSISKLTARYITDDDSSLFQKPVNDKTQPDIYVRLPTAIQDNKNSSKSNKKVTIKDCPQTFDNVSITSEMSGYDSESFYEIIRVFTSQSQC